jgi:hypothetical protein
MKKNKFKINERVLTPDGIGIVKEIKLNYNDDLIYACLLEKPFKIICPYKKVKDYDYSPYLFGYTYKESLIKKIKK